MIVYTVPIRPHDANLEIFGSSFKICSIRCQIKSVSESAKKITINGPKDRLDDRICTDLGWFAGFA